MTKTFTITGVKTIGNGRNRKKGYGQKRHEWQGKNKEDTLRPKAIGRGRQPMEEERSGEVGRRDERWLAASGGGARRREGPVRRAAVGGRRGRSVAERRAGATVDGWRRRGARHRGRQRQGGAVAEDRGACREEDRRAATPSPIPHPLLPSPFLAVASGGEYNNDAAATASPYHARRRTLLLLARVVLAGPS
ncbi:hypothetical protein DAI22_01g210400 [Oryza sativa Japonica Group]|nr:hypothetical protein DAI22_01g210400 [Oryza sativa Japonica Group]